MVADALDRAAEEKAVRAYEPLVESLARRFDGAQGAEYDDLAQEGRIAVLGAIRDGEFPSEGHVTQAMKAWVRTCARRGFGGYEGEGA